MKIHSKLHDQCSVESQSFICFKSLCYYRRVPWISPPYTALTHTWQVLELGFVIAWISLYCLRQFMNIIETSKRMASCQRTVKTLSYKPDGNVFVWVGAKKMEGGLIRGTLRYIHCDASVSICWFRMSMYSLSASSHDLCHVYTQLLLHANIMLRP